MNAVEPDFDPHYFGIGRLFDYVRDAIIVADAASERIVLWNPWATQIFGYSRSEALRLPLHSLVPERFRTSHRQGIARYQRTGTGRLLEDTTAPIELSGLHKDGHEVPIELTLTPLPETTPDGHRFALAIVRDVSERVAAQEAQAMIREAELLRRQALQLNDDVVQGLVVAKMALELKEPEKSAVALERTLGRAQAIVSGLLSDLRGGAPVQPGDLVRDPESGSQDA